LAVAQQSGTKQEPAKSDVKSPRDVATGQASGKQMHQPAASQSDAMAREASTGKATGKTMAQDDWHARSAATSGDPHVKAVSSTTEEAAGVRESPSKASLRESPTKASTGRTTEVSSDDASGVRESPSKASLRESPSKASTGSTRVATGDVNGDGKADKTAGQSSVQSPRDSSTGMASGKRQYQPVIIRKRIDPSSSTAADSTPKK
jgi:hypothetical protein